MKNLNPIPGSYMYSEFQDLYNQMTKKVNPEFDNLYNKAQNNIMYYNMDLEVNAIETALKHKEKAFQALNDAKKLVKSLK